MVFVGVIVKMSFLLRVPVRGKMNKINVLTLTNNNLVVFFFPDMASIFDKINGTSVPTPPPPRPNSMMSTELGVFAPLG